MWYIKHWQKCSKTKLWAYKYLGIWIIAFGSRMGPLWFSKVYHRNGKIGFANYLWIKVFWKNEKVAKLVVYGQLDQYLMWYIKHWEKCSKTKLWAYKYIGIWIIAFGWRMGSLWFSKVHHRNRKNRIW